MAAPGLGAFLQAQKRAKEAALARAQSQKGVSKPGESMKDQKAEGNEQEGKEPEKEKEKEKEKERVTVATLAKQVVDNATANSARMRRYVRPPPHMQLLYFQTPYWCTCMYLFSQTLSICRFLILDFRDGVTDRSN